MSALHSILSHCWAIPFALALLIPGRRALLAVAAIVTPVLVGFNLGSDARFVTATMMTLGIAFNLALGTIVQAAIPGIFRHATRRMLTAPVIIWGALALPGTMIPAFTSMAHGISTRIHHWEARTPPRACLARTYPVRVGRAVYRLPAAPVITVRTAGQAYHFQYSQSLRRACRHAAQTRVPIRATDLNLDFTIPARKAFCSVARGNWARALCRKDGARANFPAMANIYVPDTYDPRHLMPKPAYIRFADAQKKARAGGHPFLPQPAGAFEHYADGYWVARKGTWKDDAGEPYTIHCEKTDAPGVLSCETGYRLKSGATLSYSFAAPRRSLARRARALDRRLHAMLTEFSQGTPVDPRKILHRHHG